MRPGREIDARVAQEIFGYEVWAKNKVLHEKTPEGDRPLRHYSRDMEFAWPVAERMRVSLISTEGGHWFAFVGPGDGWESPKDFLEYLDKGDFTLCAAAVDTSAPKAICDAALKAMEKIKHHGEMQEENEDRPPLHEDIIIVNNEALN
jgi:hypothetical protein